MSKDTHPLIAGFTAGVVSTSLLLPLDVVKVSVLRIWRVYPLERVRVLALLPSNITTRRTRWQQIDGLQINHSFDVIDRFDFK
jgi:hypothetical protein